MNAAELGERALDAAHLFLRTRRDSETATKARRAFLAAHWSAQHGPCSGAWRGCLLEIIRIACGDPYTHAQGASVHPQAEAWLVLTSQREVLSGGPSEDSALVAALEGLVS